LLLVGSAEGGVQGAARRMLWLAAKRGQGPHLGCARRGAEGGGEVMHAAAARR
jgi:hypothetical protein